MTRITLFTLLSLLSTFSHVIYASLAPLDHSFFQQDAKNISLLLVVDSSSSMFETDRANLRGLAVQLIASLLDPGDEIGFVEFNSIVQDSFGMTKVDSSETVNYLLDRLTQVGSHPGGLTDMLAAFQRGCEILASAAPDNERYVIFLTDGEPYPKSDWSSSVTASRKEQYEQQVRAAARACDAPIVAVGLSSGARMDFLESLPNTNGRAIMVASANDLPAHFLRIFGGLADRYVPESTLSPGQSLSLSVDRDTVLAVSFVLVRQGLSCSQAESCMLLLDPNGQRPDEKNGKVDSFAGRGFVVTTVHSPLQGTWIVSAASIGNGVIHTIIRSRLRLRLLKPQTVQPAGHPVHLQISVFREQEDGSVIALSGDRDRLVRVTISQPSGQADAFDLFDNGVGDDAVAGDGIYTLSYTRATEPGVYKVLLSTYEKGIPVQAAEDFEIERFPELALIAPAIHQGLELSPGMPIELRAQLLPPQEDGRDDEPGKLISAKAEVKDGNGRLVDSLDMIVGSNGEAIGELLLSNPPDALQVEVLAEAEYLGVLYQTSSGVRTVPVRLVEQISHNLRDELDFGQAFKVQDLASIQFSAQSWTKSSVKMTARVVGIPGLEASLSPRQMEPGSPTSMELRLSYSGEPLPAKDDYRGKIILEAEGIQVRSHEIPFAFAIGQPTVTYVLPPNQPILEFGDAFRVQDFEAQPLRVTVDGADIVTLTARVVDAVGLKAIVEPTALRPGSDQSIYFRLVEDGDKPMKPGDYRGKLILEAPGNVVEPSPSVGFHAKLAQRTLYHTLTSQAFLSLDSLDAITVPFQITANFPETRTLAIMLLDAQQREVGNFKTIIEPTQLLQPGKSMSLTLTLKPENGANLLQSWKQTVFVLLSAGSDVKIADTNPVEFKFSQDSGLARGWKVGLSKVSDLIIHIILPFVVGLVVLLLLYSLFSVIWVLINYIRGRHPVVRLVPYEIYDDWEITEDKTRAMRVLKSSRWQSQAFGLAVGSSPVPLVYRVWFIERFLAFPWIYFFRAEVTDTSAPAASSETPSKLKLRIRRKASRDKQVLVSRDGQGTASWAKVPGGGHVNLSFDNETMRTPRRSLPGAKSLKHRKWVSLENGVLLELDGSIYRLQIVLGAGFFDRGLGFFG